MHPHPLVSIACALTCALPLTARSITLDEALGAARSENKEIKVATLELAQSQRENSVNDWLPSISLQVGASASASVIDKSFNSSYSLGGVTWSLDSATRSANKANRILSNESALLAYQSKVNSIDSKVTTAYWNAEAARLAWESRQNTLKRNQRALQTIQDKFEAGTATTLSVSQAEMSVADSQYQAQIARQTYQTALTTLSNLTGLDIGEDTVLQEMPGNFTLQDRSLPTGNLEDTTTIKQYALALARARQTLADATSEGKGISVNVTAKTSFGDTIYSYRDHDGSWGFSDFADTTTLGVTVSVPLDHLFRNSSASIAIDSARYDIQIAELNLQQALDDLRTDVENAITSVRQTEDNLHLLDHHLALAQEQLELTQASYDAGKSSFSDLEDAKQAVSDAELSKVQQQLNHTIALYDLATLLECPVADLTR